MNVRSINTWVTFGGGVAIGIASNLVLELELGVWDWRFFFILLSSLAFLLGAALCIVISQRCNDAVDSAHDGFGNGSTPGERACDLLKKYPARATVPLGGKALMGWVFILFILALIFGAVRTLWPIASTPNDAGSDTPAQHTSND